MKLREHIIENDIKNICSRVNLDDLRNSNILLTGANGLLGFYFAHLFYYLNIKNGYNISCDFVTKSEVLENSKIFSIKNSPGFKLVRADLSNENPYTGKYDFIIYAAGYSAPSQFLENPIEVIRVNYIGMENVLNYSLHSNQKARILYFSSSEIYGNPPNEFIPTPETYPGNSGIDNSRACYIESKRLTEVLCRIYKEKFNIDVKIVRPALTYGPGMGLEDKRVISQFIKKAHKEKKIDMLDDGSDRRCFSYIEDTMVELLNVLLFGKEIVYNIGSDREEISIKELAEIIGKIMGVPVNVGGKGNNLAGAPKRVCLDISKVKSEFHFSPRVTMYDGLKRTIDWALSE